jgi:hypothetical protein
LYVDYWRDCEDGRLRRAIAIGLSCCELFLVRRAGWSGSGIILHILFLDDF